jgi:hypothetical protein
MSATLQISVDYDDDLKARELLDDLMPTIEHWMFNAGIHFGDTLELESPGRRDLLPGYREAAIIPTNHVINDEPVRILISYAVPPGTENGRGTCYIGPEKKVRNKAEVLARTYTVVEVTSR